MPSSITVRAAAPLWLALVALLLGACDQVQQVLPAGREEAQWTVDPRADVGPDSTQIPLLVGEIACASGRDATGRISVDVGYRDDAIVVTAYVRPLQGDQNCQGNPPTPYVLELDQPLGDRELVNGATTEIAQRPLEVIGDGPLGGPPEDPSDDDVPDHVRFIAEALQARAVDPSELEDVGDLSLHPDGVELLLGPRTVRTAEPAALREPRAWELDGPYAGADGPFSALESLASTERIQVSMGARPHCASPPRTAPDGLEGLQRVAIEPVGSDECLRWFVVNLYLDDDGLIRAVQLDLWEP